MKPGTNCRTGSAWHDWQLEGAAWRNANPTATLQAAKVAAVTFANTKWGALPDIGRDAARRGFLECAR